MASQRAARARTLVLCLLGASLAAAGRAAAQDPFQPGLRWTQGPGAATPGIPRAVAFGAEENAAWAAWSGTDAAFSAGAAHALGPNDALGREPVGPGASGSLGVAAGAGPWVFALAQIAAPDAWHRRTLVRAVWIDDVAGPAGLGSRWTRELPFTANGAARIATGASGESAWVAAFDDAGQRVRLERLDAVGGAVLWGRELDAAGLQELAVSADGSRAVLSAGLDLYVLDAQGATVHHAALTAATTALAIAGDGRSIAHGAPGILRVLRDGPQGFTLSSAAGAGPGELAVRAALDGVGATLAIGWWSADTGTAWRFEVWDLAGAQRLEARAFAGPTGGLQDLPTAVALTPDGARAAFACWGGPAGSGSGAPEAAIWDRVTDRYVAEADLPGSAFALALGEGGTRALVGSKATHANLLSATGAVSLLDTGERELQVLAPPVAGGVLHLAARSAGASAVLFLSGDPAPAPFSVPGVAGDLLLRRTGLGVARVPADAQGRADWTTPIPGGAALVGTVRSFQAAFRGPAGTWVGTTLARVRIL